MALPKYSPVKNKPIRTVEYYAAAGARNIDGVLYTGVVIAGPNSGNATQTVVATTDATWTAIATGLSNVVYWRLSERSGNDFRYAYVAAPGANFSTGFGILERNSELVAIYVQRPAANNVTMELEYWTAS